MVRTPYFNVLKKTRTEKVSIRLPIPVLCTQIPAFTNITGRFWEGSPCDSYGFLSDRYRLSTKQAFGLIGKLESARKSYRIYNTLIPRHDPNNTTFDQMQINGAAQNGQNPLKRILMGNITVLYDKWCGHSSNIGDTCNFNTN